MNSLPDFLKVSRTQAIQNTGEALLDWLTRYQNTNLLFGGATVERADMPPLTLAVHLSMCERFGNDYRDRAVTPEMQIAYGQIWRDCCAKVLRHTAERFDAIGAGPDVELPCAWCACDSNSPVPDCDCVCHNE